MRGQQPERWGWEKYLAFPEAHAAALVDVAEALRAALDPEVIDDTALATKLARAYIAALDRLDAAKATP